MEPDDLYGLPADRFVAERDALTKSLRKAGRRDEAAAVAALRKPSVAAWAVNQLVRTQDAAWHALLRAGDELREAQDALLTGRGDGAALRAAAHRERTAIETLMDAARGLSSSGDDALSLALLERVAETLHAAALDESAREQVRDGRLERELRHAGLGFGDALVPAAAPRDASAKGSRRPSDVEGDAPTLTPAQQRSARVHEEARRAESERRELVAARTAARAAEAAARRRAESASRGAAEAEVRREHAAEALRDADEALAAAREDAAMANAALATAQEEMATADSALAAAQAARPTADNALATAQAARATADSALAAADDDAARAQATLDDPPASDHPR